MKYLWFGFGLVTGLVTLSIAVASVPSISPAHVTDDTALYQSLSEIRIPKQGKINFDGDIAKLSQMEKRYREKLPSLRSTPV